jgi:hypothetical protein
LPAALQIHRYNCCAADAINSAAMSTSRHCNPGTIQGVEGG